MDSRPDDETLLLAVAGRDMGAFPTLYERHAGWLAIRLARRCNDRDLVADAIQDTFVAVWQKPRGFRGDGDIGQERRRRCSAKAYWCFADLLAVAGQLSTPVPALGQVS